MTAWSSSQCEVAHLGGGQVSDSDSDSYIGGITPDPGPAPRVRPRGRVCYRRGCETVLSIYNETNYCALHQPDPTRGSDFDWGERHLVWVKEPDGTGWGGAPDGPKHGPNWEELGMVNAESDRSVDHCAGFVVIHRNGLVRCSIPECAKGTNAKSHTLFAWCSDATAGRCPLCGFAGEP